ncbi:MAG: TatD family hydrolase [Chloroflexota bacterium]
MRLIDSHGHLQAKAFADDADRVYADARAAGLERLMAPGFDVATSLAGVVLAARLGVLTSVGFHPHVAAEVTPADRDLVAGLASEPRVRAIGETGLDYDRAFSPRDAQLANLRWHIDLARMHGKPLILHCRSKPGRRDAQDDLIAALRAAGVGTQAFAARFEGRPPALLHSFSGPVDYAEAALGLGCAVSISGLAFRAGEEATAQVAGIVPDERLLVETDCPYLAPPGAPRRNEPRWVEVTARWVAEQRSVDPEQLGDQLVDAFDRTFGPPA